MFSMPRRQREISDKVIGKTARYLFNEDIVKAEILTKLLDLQEKQEDVKTEDIVIAVQEDGKISTTSTNIIKQLNKLKSMGLVEVYTPIGLKRPKYWELTEVGRKVAEMIKSLQESGERRH